MPLVITIGFGLLVVLAALIAVFNAYYQKAGRGFALVRTGFGKQRVVIDGGCLSLPFLHSTERVATNGITLSVGCEGERTLMTGDHIPIDLVMEFVLRVQPDVAGVRRAAHRVGGMNLNADDLLALFRGRFIDAMQAEICQHTLTDLHHKRANLASAVQQRLGAGFESVGLALESAALIRLDQGLLSALNDNNALHVQGMRRVAEIVSENRKQRAEIEADAEIAIRSSTLAETRDRVEFERQQQEAEISLGETVGKLKAQSESRAVAVAEQEARKSAEARLQRERGVREAEIERDLALRQREIASLTDAESAKIDSHIVLSKRQMAEIKAEAALEASRGEVVRAQEEVQSEKERLGAQRKLEQATLRAAEQRDVEAIASRRAADSLLEKANAEATATSARMSAEAGGRSAIIAAENAMDEKIIRMKLEQQKISVLPEVAEKVSKPLEKIDSIRINHLGGAGLFGAAPGGGGGQSPSPFTEAMQSILAMSVQLPALKKLGEEIGLDMDANLATRASDAISRSRPRSDSGAGSGVTSTKTVAVTSAKTVAADHRHASATPANDTPASDPSK